MKKTNSVLLSTPYLLWMAAFTLVPLGVVGYYALTDPSTGVFTLGNVRNLGMYLPVLWKSIAYSFVSAMICLLLGYPVAYYIAHCSETAQKFLYMLIMLPMCMSFLLRTLAWVGLLQDTGIINNILDVIGIGRLHLIRTPGAEDARRNQITLTEKGQAAIQGCIQAFTAVSHRMLAGFTQEERQQLLVLRRRMLENLRRPAPQPPQVKEES